MGKASRKVSLVLIENGENNVGIFEEDGSQHPNEQQPGVRKEDMSIAQDRVALERCEEEIGYFMSRSFNDGYLLTVENMESETRRSGRSPCRGTLISPSNSSQDSAGSESTYLYLDELRDKVHTEEEF